MAKVPRRHALVAVALAASTAWAAVSPLGCGPGGRPPQVNVAYGLAPNASSASASASAPLWSRFGELSSYGRANGPRFVSAGHFFARFDADVLVNAIAAPAYSALRPGLVVPSGAVVVKVHHLHGTDEPGPLLAIEKDPPGAASPGVRFVEMDATGHVLRAGRLAPCVGCHAQVASQDELFGVPLDAR